MEKTAQTQQLDIGERVSLSTGTVAVDAVQAQQMFVGLQASVHGEVYATANTQYVVADFSTEGVEEPTQEVRRAAKLVLDGTQYDVVERSLFRNMRRKQTVSVAFGVPRDVAITQGHVSWQTESDTELAAWPLADQTATTLNEPPDFTVQSFHVPEIATEDSSTEVVFEVENTGGSDGTFIAELGSMELSDQGEISFTVPVGKTISHTENVSLIGQAGSTETVILNWGRNEIERTVRIKE